MKTIPSITAFENAVSSRPVKLRTLREFEVELISVSRTAFFAEARIAFGGKGYLLSAPLTKRAWEIAENAVRRVRHCDCSALVELRRLPDELRFEDSAGRTGECDLYLYALPEGETLDCAVTHIETRLLRGALEVLKAEMTAKGVVHSNLKPSNLIYGTDGRLYPIRYSYLRTDASAAEVEVEIGDIARYIDSFPEIGPAGVSAVEPYENRAGFESFDEISPMQYMMHRVQRNGLYGFVDENGATIIEPQFEKANNFFENRAVVKTAEGWGVIDRRGGFVIEPVYDSIEYEVDSDTFLVCGGDGCFRCDYLGKNYVKVCMKDNNN